MRFYLLVSLFFILVVIASTAVARKLMQNDLYVFPGGTSNGPRKFAQLTSKFPNGSTLYCTDCQATCPAVGSGSGANCTREQGVWNCCRGGALSTTFLWSPYEPAAPVGKTLTNGEADSETLVCVRWVPFLGIAGATRVTYRFQALGNPGSIMGQALYSDDGTTRHYTNGGRDKSVAEVVTDSVSAFSIAPGVPYQKCYCPGTDFSGTMDAVEPTSLHNNLIGNATGTPIYTVATNKCVSGVPPTTTGTLTGNTTDSIFDLYWLFKVQ